MGALNRTPGVVSPSNSGRDRTELPISTSTITTPPDAQPFERIWSSVRVRPLRRIDRLKTEGHE